MSRLSSILFGVALGAGLVYGALNYHVLRTDEGIEFIPKLSATFSETYLDVRRFGVSDWADHQLVARAVIKAGKDDLLAGSATRSLQEGVQGLIDNIRR
jgi:hypothetical protein